MEEPGKFGNVAGDLDVGDHTSANPLIFPPHADVETFSYGDERKAGDSHSDKCDAGDNMGYAEINSSEDDNQIDELRRRN